MMILNKKKTFCFIIYLDQDVDILVPIIEFLKSRQNTIRVIVSAQIVKKSPRILRSLQTKNIDFQIFSIIQNFFKILNVLWKSDIIMTAVETSVRPHSYGHKLTHIANALGKKTITMQHGLENIGLTYSDKDYPIKEIHFASQFILIWGKKDTLHKDIPARRLKRCIEFGCPKAFNSLALPPIKKPSQFTVSYFENLHWGRYSNDYRKEFLETIELSIIKNPDTFFFIKPHHAGNWLNRTKPDFIKNSSNVFVIDPKDTLWDQCTGPSIISISDFIITTPSTIALDAAMMNVPVAVFGYDLNLNLYNPLRVLKSTSETLQEIAKLRTQPDLYASELQIFCQKNNNNPNCLMQIENLLNI